MRSLFATLLVLLPLAGFSQTPFPPVDEALNDPSFLAFRQHLFKIIKKRDAHAMQKALTQEFSYSFGPEEETARAFRKHSNFDDPVSDFWLDLEQLLKLGGRLEGEGSFTAPYVFTNWPEDTDPFESMAVIGSDVRVRKAPDTQARVLARLGYSTVTVVDTPDKHEGWYRVKLEDGREGYVNSRYLRSPLDYRAGFQKVDGRWLMTFFIAGD